MPDYMFLLESRLSAEQRAALMRVQELAAAASANVYLAGGAVRDLTSGMPIRDLDFTVEGSPFRLARELEKGGARVLGEDEQVRQVELIFSGDVDGSIAAAHDEIYARPGTKPEIRWSTIMEDLRRRDFSVNAVAISLNPASRGLLLDPTNGLADLEKREVRALSIHSFTNQPVRLLRALRYSARMGFKMEGRTAEWFALAIERGLHEQIPADDVGREVRQVSREEKPVAILKSWEAHGLLGCIHAQLPRRHPPYEALQRIVRVRDDMANAGYRPRLFAPVRRALLGRLKPREQSAALGRMEFRSAEIQSVLHLDDEAKKIVKMLAGRKTAAPRDAYAFLEKVPLGLLGYILAEVSHSKAVAKIRNYLHKWKPLQQALPAVGIELEALGMPRGPKFDKVLEELFQQQLLGKGRHPEDRIKLLRKLSGIKEPPKKAKEEKKKVVKASKKKPVKEEAAAAPAAGLPQADVATPARKKEKAEPAASAPKPAARPSAPAAKRPAAEASAKRVKKPAKSRPSKAARRPRPARRTARKRK